MNFSNYSAETAVDEALTYRENIPELLRHAAALESVDWLRNHLEAVRGLPRGTVTTILRSCGLEERPRSAPPPPAVERFLSLGRREFHKLTPAERHVVLSTFADLGAHCNGQSGTGEQAP